MYNVKNNEKIHKISTFKKCQNKCTIPKTTKKSGKFLLSKHVKQNVPYQKQQQNPQHFYFENTLKNVPYQKQQKKSAKFLLLKHVK
jgi:hypothetical protein